MTPARRALLLGGLALVLGVLAAGDVAGREAAVRAQIGPLVPVVVATRDLDAGRRLAADGLGVRRVPVRYAPADRVDDPALVVGERLRAPVAAGADVAAAALGEPAAVASPVRPGERVAEVVAAGDPATVVAGARVDVLITTGEETEAGRTRVALADAEVLGVSPAPAPEAGDGGGRFLAVRLRATARQAVHLAAAQSFARELRLLARNPEDRADGLQGLTVDGETFGAGR